MRLLSASPSVRVICIGVFLVLASCTSHPLDIPDAEWEALTPAQRRLAGDREAALFADQAWRARPEVAERDRFQVLEDAARADRVARRRQRMRLGDSLDCAIRDGVARFPDLGWSPVEATGFRVIRGDRQGLLLPARRAGVNRALALEYTDSGVSLRLCGDGGRSETCTTVAAPWHDLKNGVTWQVVVPETLAATLRCAFTPGPPVSVMELD